MRIDFLSDFTAKKQFKYHLTFRDGREGSKTVILVFYARAGEDKRYRYLENLLLCTKESKFD